MKPLHREDKPIPTLENKTGAAHELYSLCKEHIETVVHIMSALSVLVLKGYADRHNQVYTEVHFELCRYYQCNINVSK